MTTLELAAAMRAGTEDFSPARLWYSTKVDGADYNEAMIHAGAVGPKQDGPFRPFDVCPKCGAALGEAVSLLPDLPEMTDEERAAAASCLRRMADRLSDTTDDADDTRPAGNAPPAIDRDPRAVKRERQAIRRELIALIEKRLRTRRCYWTWPWGHDYGTRSRITTHSSSAWDVSLCDVCDTPCSWDSFGVRDLVHFARGHRKYVDVESLATDEELAPYENRWRALGD